MKQTADLDQVQFQMSPGIITQSGFLGNDRRLLNEILTADQATISQCGLTHHRIADRLRYFREIGSSGLGNWIRHEPHYEIRVDSVRGKLPCPFRHPGLYEKTFTIVRNIETRQEIIFTDLQIHLIDAHGFYQGEGSPYRLDPKFLIRVLDINARQDETPE